MRASYDTLFSKAKGVLNQDPFSGHLFFEGADMEKRFIDSPKEIKKSAFPLSQELPSVSL